MWLCHCDCVRVWVWVVLCIFIFSICWPSNALLLLSFFLFKTIPMLCLRAVFILTMQMVLCPCCSASTISLCSTSLISRSWCWIWFAIWAIRWHVNIEFPALDGHPPPREIIRTLKATSIFNTYCTRFIDFFFLIQIFSRCYTPYFPMPSDRFLSFVKDYLSCWCGEVPWPAKSIFFLKKTSPSPAWPHHMLRRAHYSLRSRLLTYFRSMGNDASASDLSLVPEHARGTDAIMTKKAHGSCEKPVQVSTLAFNSPLSDASYRKWSNFVCCLTFIRIIFCTVAILRPPTMFAASIDTMRSTRVIFSRAVGRGSQMCGTRVKWNIMTVSRFESWRTFYYFKRSLF